MTQGIQRPSPLRMENTHALQLLRNRYAQMPMPDEVLTRLIDIEAKLGLSALDGEVFANVYQSATATRQYFDVSLPALRIYGQRKGVRGVALEWLAEDGSAHRAWVRANPPAACVATITPAEELGLPRTGIARLEVARRYTIGPSGQPETDVVWLLRAAERLAEAAEREALLALFPEVETALQPLTQQPYHGPQTLSATEAEIMKRGGGAGNATTGAQAIAVPPPIQRAPAPEALASTGSAPVVPAGPPPLQRPPSTPLPAQRPSAPPARHPQPQDALSQRVPAPPPPAVPAGQHGGRHSSAGSSGECSCSSHEPSNGTGSHHGNGRRPPSQPPGDEDAFF